MKPKITLRDLFWLVLLAAIGCAWWLDRSKLASEVERLIANEMIRIEGIVVGIDQNERLVNVSVGFDDGATKGDILEVHRGNLKIGEIALRHISPDTSQGLISSQQSPVQSGDRVTLSVRPEDWHPRLKAWPLRTH